MVLPLLLLAGGGTWAANWADKEHNDGRAREWIGGQFSEKVSGPLIERVTGFDMDTIKKASKSLQGDDAQNIAQSPLIALAASVLSFGIQKGMTDNSTFTAAATSALAGGAVRLLQQYALPAAFDKAAEDKPPAPAQELTGTIGDLANNSRL